MAQAIFETAFDVVYLISVVAAGLIMLRRSKPGSVVQLFGLMAVVLGAGDTFHLVPRMWALWTTGLAANAVALGVGKLITSITMTVFYVLLYGIWRLRYQVRGRVWLDAAVWSLAGLRVALSLLPQNDWFSANPPLLYGVLRNLPFAALGVLLIVLFAQEARRTADVEFRWMWLAVTLSFALYVPVVLLGNSWPPIGMLMVPKTLAYVWIVAMGWQLYRKGEAA